VKAGRFSAKEQQVPQGGLRPNNPKY